MIPKALDKFMSKVIQATADDTLKWQAGADEAYFAVQKDANLHLRHFLDQETGAHGYLFRISRRGNDAVFSVNNEEDDYHFMSNLYSAVSINAAGGDEFVEGLFD